MPRPNVNETKRRPGRPSQGGPTPSRSIRLGAVYDRALKVAERRGDKLPAVIERALQAYVKEHEMSTETITLSRTDDQGTETMTVTRNDNEVRTVYAVDGNVVDDSIAYDGGDVDGWLHARLVEWGADGWAAA